MSEENVDVIRRGWEAWGRGDMSSIFEMWNPEIVWDMTNFRDWPESTYEGYEGVSRFLTEWLEVWDSYEVGVEKMLEAPDGRVVTLAWQRAKGKHSGLAMEMEWAQIATVRDGKISRIDNYDDRSKALEAAGLSEQGAKQRG
jgi:ketosteroid isomerase-like protein